MSITFNWTMWHSQGMDGKADLSWANAGLDCQMVWTMTFGGKHVIIDMSGSDMVIMLIQHIVICMLFLLHFTFCMSHFTHCSLHVAVCALHLSLYTLRFTPCALDVALYMLLSTHCSLLFALYMLRLTCCTLHIVLYMLHIAHCT